MELKTIELELISPHPGNPRDDMGDLTALAESIKTLGMLQAPGVMSTGGTRYIAEFGHRRIEAARLAGLTEIAVVVREETPADVYMALIAENEMQKPLTGTERARGQQGLLEIGDLDRVSKATGYDAKLLKAAYRGRALVDKSKVEQATLDELATLAEFEDEPAAFAKLEKELGNGVRFDYAAQAIRREKKAAEKLAAELANAEALGAIETERDYNKHITLDEARDETDGPIDPALVPKGELLYYVNYGELKYLITRETLSAQGWHSRYGGRIATPEEIAKREAREAEYRARQESENAAEASRYAFLRGRVAKMPPALVGLIGEQIKSAVNSWGTYDLGNELAMELLGATATPKAQTLINAALLATLDARMMAEEDTVPPYLEALTALGYTLTDYEQGVIAEIAAEAEPETPEEIIEALAETETCPDSLDELAEDAETLADPTAAQDAS